MLFLIYFKRSSLPSPLNVYLTLFEDNQVTSFFNQSLKGWESLTFEKKLFLFVEKGWVHDEIQSKRQAPLTNSFVELFFFQILPLLSVDKPSSRQQLRLENKKTGTTSCVLRCLTQFEALFSSKKDFGFRYCSTFVCL